MPAATGSSAPTQTGRHAELITPLGKDKLLINRIDAEEALSTLFEFSFHAITPVGTSVPFDKLIGQSVTVKLVYPGTSKVRYFNGLCRSVTQGESDIVFTHYRLGVVPKLWLLTRQIRCRIFQQLTVPEILKKVLAAIDVKFEIQGTFEKRDYVVQYRESDYHFAARLMEEEGIYYFFKHSDGAHQMIVGNTPGTHLDVPYESAVKYKNVNQAQIHEEDLIYSLNRQQELTSGKVTLWDHCFETPGKNLEAVKEIQESVAFGTLTHKLKVGNNDNLEIYDYPGEYAQRFDGVAPGGGDRAADVQKIFQDNKRTTEIRMQAEASRGVALNGTSTCRQLTSGHKFTVKTGDDLSKPMGSDGAYVITSISHHANVQDEYASGGTADFSYRNNFTAIPLALPFRPQRTLKKPTVAGCQTATVVGPAGEEIFTDKYGRVKVQFHWDREGKKDADSSCWIRVGTNWAGRNWGIYAIPRIGQEVIVDFLEGDPDQPIIIGNVFNADQMPAYKLPDEKTKSWIKTNTSMGGVGHNEIRFEDKKAAEQIFMHGEKDLDVRIKHDTRELVLNDRHMIIGQNGDSGKVGNLYEEVFVNKQLKVHKDHQVNIGGSESILIGGIDGEGNQDIIIKKDQTVLIENNQDIHIKKDQKTLIDGNHAITIGGKIAQTFGSDVGTEISGKLMTKIGADQSLEVSAAQKTKIASNQDLEVGSDQRSKIGGSLSMQVSQDEHRKVGQKLAVEAGQEIHLKSGAKIIIEAGAQISLKGPGGFIDIGPSGVTIQGTMVLINSGGAAGSGSGASPKNPDPPESPQKADKPKDAKKAEPRTPDLADNSPSGSKSC